MEILSKMVQQQCYSSSLSIDDYNIPIKMEYIPIDNVDQNSVFTVPNNCLLQNHYQENQQPSLACCDKLFLTTPISTISDVSFEDTGSADKNIICNESIHEESISLCTNNTICKATTLMKGTYSAIVIDEFDVDENVQSHYRYHSHGQQHVNTDETYSWDIASENFEQDQRYIKNHKSPLPIDQQYSVKRKEIKQSPITTATTDNRRRRPSTSTNSSKRNLLSHLSHRGQLMADMLFENMDSFILHDEDLSIVSTSNDDKTSSKSLLGKNKRVTQQKKRSISNVSFFTDQTIDSNTDSGRFLLGSIPYEEEIYETDNGTIINSDQCHNNIERECSGKFNLITEEDLISPQHEKQSQKKMNFGSIFRPSTMTKIEVSTKEIEYVFNRLNEIEKDNLARSSSNEFCKEEIDLLKTYAIAIFFGDVKAQRVMEMKRNYVRNIAIISKIKREISKTTTTRRNSILRQERLFMNKTKPFYCNYLDDVIKSCKSLIIMKGKREGQQKQRMDFILNRSSTTSSSKQGNDITYLLQKSIDTIRSCYIDKKNNNNNKGSNNSNSECSLSHSFTSSNISNCFLSDNVSQATNNAHHDVYNGIPEDSTSVTDSISSTKSDDDETTMINNYYSKKYFNYQPDVKRRNKKQRVVLDRIEI